MAWLTPKTDWTEEDFYNATDLNRVENNTSEVATLIQQLVGSNVGLETIRTNRDYTSIEFVDSLNRVERNIGKLSVLSLPGLKPARVWSMGDAFSYKDATRYETNLSLLYSVLSRNVAQTIFCGTYNCGEDVI